jgi:hypothetical protein
MGSFGNCGFGFDGLEMGWKMGSFVGQPAVGVQLAVGRGLAGGNAAARCCAPEGRGVRRHIMLLYLYRGCCAFGRANAQRKNSKPRFWVNNAEKNFIFLDFQVFARCAFGRAGWGVALEFVG